jgi:hypothetical protein
MCGNTTNFTIAAKIATFAVNLMRSLNMFRSLMNVYANSSRGS